tara:strand:+ start:2293 stop:2784 length:492 start_codon:yes stop_codon:yes gene_type:complete
MSDKEIDKFNGLMSEFIDKLVNQFNDSDKLKNYRKAFLVFKMTSPKVPVNLFMAGTINYKEHIKKRDENFFLTDVSFDNLSKQLGNFTNDIGLVYHWSNISPKTKTAIWDYIQSLYVLGEIIVNKNKEVFDRYNILYVSDYKQEISTIQNGNFSDDFLRKLNS